MLLISGERELVGEERDWVNGLLGQEFQEELNCVAALSLECFDCEGIGSDDLKLLEIMGRVFAAFGSGDPGED